MFYIWPECGVLGNEKATLLFCPLSLSYRYGASQFSDFICIKYLFNLLGRPGTNNMKGEQ